IAVLLLSVLFIESVFGLSFVPDKINFNIYPGENKTLEIKIINDCSCISNFTINSSGICEYNDNLYLNPNEQMPFNLYLEIPKDAEIGNYSCKLTINGTFIEIGNPIFSNGCTNCGSGGSFYYDFSRLYNGTRVELDKTKENKTIIVEIPPDDIEENITTNEIKETQTTDTKKRFNGTMIMIFVILVILFIFGIFMTIRRLRKKNENSNSKE
ncbi:MAG: hypothetical protein AABY22_11190, partial [Nanoarchaeota archaeon]